MLNYLAFIATIAGVYAMLGLSLVTIWGQAGMVNLGLAGFFAMGAYASALATTTLAAPIAIGWFAAFVVAAAVGTVVTMATRTMRGDYLAIVTLGFAEVIRLVAVNETWLTRGSDGISGIPGPYRAALGDAFNMAYLGLTWAIVLITFLILRRIIATPFGRVLRAVRDDDQVASIAGKPVLRFKIQAFAIGSGIAGVAGALYGHFTSYIAPDLFTPFITVYIFLAVTAGGYTRPAGALLGAALVIFFLEGTRFLAGYVPGISAMQAAAAREFAIGAALILILRLRPQGFLREHVRSAHIAPGANHAETG